MRLKHYAATIFVALLAAVALSGAATVGASANPANVCKAQMIEWGVNAPGTDRNAAPGDNRNAEFARVVNRSGAALNVEGWTFQDAYPHVYTLKASALPAGSPFRAEVDAGHAGDEFVMPAGSNVYLYNGVGMDGNPTNLTAALYWGASGFHHYNNAGDTISFRDLDGTAVSWVTFTPYRTRASTC